MSRFTGGWYKSYRDAWDKDLSHNVFLWAIWNALLHMATYKESHVIWEGKRRTIPPGSVILGISELAKKWDCSRTTIWKWLTYLRDAECIAYETCTRGTLITICNWSSYQISEEQVLTPRLHQVNTELTPSVRQVDTKCTPSVRQVALSEEGKKEEGKKEEGKKEERRKRIQGIRIEYPIEFEGLWKSYGMKGDKKASFEEYKTLSLTQEEKDQLPLAINNYQIQNPEPKYRKDFQRFLKMDWRPWVNAQPLLNGKASSLQEHNRQVVERYLKEHAAHETEN